MAVLEVVNCKIVFLIVTMCLRRPNDNISVIPVQDAVIEASTPSPKTRSKKVTPEITVSIQTNNAHQPCEP